MTIHWLSDFLAGAIFGSIVGMVAGNGFLFESTRMAPARSSPINPVKTKWPEAPFIVALVERHR